MGWKAIATGNLAARVDSAVADIASDLLALDGLEPGEAAEAQRNATESLRCSLGWGWPGLALFLAYFANYRRSPRYEREAWNRINLAVEGLPRVRMGPTLFFGYPGVAWAVSHMEGGGRVGGGSDTCAAIDDALYRHLANAPPSFRWGDLMGGALGCLVYAMERCGSAKAASIARLVAAELVERAVWRGPQAMWITPDHKFKRPLSSEEKASCVCVGLAHGHAGVIAGLTYAGRCGHSNDRAIATIGAAVSWLLDQKDADNEVSAFPSYVLPTRRIANRAAWCHGDFGVVHALFAVGQQERRRDWMKAAVDVALVAAKRSCHAVGALDTGICHGTAGVAHILNRMYQATGTPELRAAAIDWIERTLAMRQPGRGIGGFLSRLPSEPPTERWHATPGLVQGAAGTGLALLAAISGQEPAWDRALLLSGAESA